MEQIFKSVLEADNTAVVLCNLKHEIIYMNPAADKRYAKMGGKDLVGKSVKICHNQDSCEKIDRVLEWFLKSPENNKIYTYRNDRENKDVYMVALRNGEGKLIGYYEKHEYRDRETAGLYEFL